MGTAASEVEERDRDAIEPKTGLETVRPDSTSESYERGSCHVYAG